jgi:CRISPR-associated Csx14 family protein
MSMKSALINPMGTTPMVATEMVRYIRNTDESLKDVVLICTRSRSVISGAYAAMGAIKDKYPYIRVHIIKLEMDDISDESDLLKFLSDFVDILRRERDYAVDKFYLNLSGGRKIQNIALSVYAGIFGIDEVYNIIDKDVENYSPRYEEIKYDIIDRFTSESSSLETYQEMKERIDGIFYPPTERLSFIKVAVLKIADDEKIKLRRAINGTNFTDGSIEDFRLKAYWKSGFITFDRSRTYATDLGHIILKGME